MIGISPYDAKIRYVPALFWRQAEMLAIDNIERDILDVAPLITLKRPGVIDPPDTGGSGLSNFEETRFFDAAIQAPDSYVRKVADQIADFAFGKGRIGAPTPLPFVYCDTTDVDDATDRTMLPALLERAESPIVPVWRTRAPPSRLVPLMTWMKDGRGIAVRAGMSDLLNDFEGIPASLRGRASETDLIFDYGYITREAIFPPTSPSWFKRLRFLAKAYPWRRVVLLSGSFPAGLTRHDRFLIPRRCRELHESFAGQHDGLRVVRGDYTCIHPEIIQSNFGSHNPNLRYTIADDWVIYRRHPVPPSLPSPYRDIYRACATDPTFTSSGHSFGDRQIYDIATYDREPGWAKASLARAISHHIRTATLEARLAPS